MAVAGFGPYIVCTFAALVQRQSWRWQLGGDSVETTGPTDSFSRPERIDVYLSGGGYRAALAALGALYFLLLDGQWASVRRIVSVSGGGFVNAHLALARPTEDQLSSEIRSMFDRLTSPALTAAVAAKAVALTVLAISPAIAALVWTATASLPGWGKVLWVLGAIVTVVMAVRLVARLALHFLLKLMVGDATLESVAGQAWAVEHVLVATDLSAHGPLFFQANGIQPLVYSRARGCFDGRDVSFKQALRASTALPVLIPPTRLRVRKREVSQHERDYVWKPVSPDVDQLSLWLCDGGVTGNLGVQLLASNIQAIRLIAASSTIAGTSTGPTPYKCRRHGEPMAWECGQCTHERLIVDASGLPPGPSRVWDRVLGIPGLGWLANILRSLKVMYEAGLSSDQAGAGGSLVGAVRTEQAILRLANKNLPLDESMEWPQRLMRAGEHDQFIRHATEPELRRHLRIPESVRLAIQARDDTARVATGLWAVSPSRAGRVVASGFLNALINAPDGLNPTRAHTGMQELSRLLGPRAKLDPWWSDQIASL
jgi:predicted acylesterase/phospholipase RssA